MWIPAQEPFTTLADEAAWWASTLEADWQAARRPYERALLEQTLEILGSLPPTQGEQVLVHQDLHGDNVVAAAREPWLAIDPKPLVGEREFSVAPIVRSWELGHSKEHVMRRLDRLTAELGLDRERARLWTIAQTVAWATHADPEPRHLQTARWLTETT